MTNKRFTVEPAVVGQFGDDYVGWFVRDDFTGYPVGNGKGGFIHVYASQVALAVSVCEEMNDRTEGIDIEDSAVHVPSPDAPVLNAA